MITSRHLFLIGCLVASQLELLYITFHFPKDIFYSSLLCASFVFPAYQAEAMSPTVPPKSAVYFSPVVVTDNFQVKSYKWKLDPQLKLKHSSLELLPHSVPG